MIWSKEDYALYKLHYKRISGKRFVNYDEYVDNLYQQELSML